MTNEEVAIGVIEILESAYLSELGEGVSITPDGFNEFCEEVAKTSGRSVFSNNNRINETLWITPFQSPSQVPFSYDHKLRTLLVSYASAMVFFMNFTASLTRRSTSSMPLTTLSEPVGVETTGAQTSYDICPL